MQEKEKEKEWELEQNASHQIFTNAAHETIIYNHM